MDSAIEFLASHAVHFTLLGVVATYLLYYFIFSYFIVPFVGNYDITKKNIGKTLPFYPNGWYVACKSKELPIDTAKNI